VEGGARLKERGAVGQLSPRRQDGFYLTVNCEQCGLGWTFDQNVGLRITEAVIQVREQVF